MESRNLATGAAAPAPIRRGGRAYLYAIAGRGFRATGKIVVLLVAARSASITEVGQFAFLVVVGTLAGVVFDLGLSEFVVREVPAGRFSPSRLVVAAARIRVAGLLLAIGGGWVAASVLGGGPVGLPGAAAIAYGAAGVAADFLAAVHRGHGRYDREALESAAGAFAPIGLVVVLLVLFDPLPFDRFQLALGGAATALALVRLLTTAGARTSPDGAVSARRVVAASRWFLARALLGWATFDSAPILLALLADEHQVALFAAAMRPVGLLTHPFLALGYVFSPALAHDLVTSRARLEERTLELNRIALALVPACFAACMLGGHLLLTGFGEDYRVALTTVTIAALGYTFYLGTLSGLPLVAMGRERAVAIGQTIALAVIVVAMVLLIPREGADGAATALVIGLATSKLIHVAQYRLAGLPLGGPAALAGLGAIAAWIAISLSLPRPAGFASLLAGGTVAAALALRRIRAVTLFRDPGGAPADP